MECVVYIFNKAKPLNKFFFILSNPFSLSIVL